MNDTNDNSDRGSLHVASFFLSVDASAGTFITFMLFVLGLWALVEAEYMRASPSTAISSSLQASAHRPLHAKLSCTNPMRRWRIHLLLACLFSTAVSVMDGSLTWLNWTGYDEACRNITIPHVLFYIIAKQFLYLFLFDRAKIVHSSLKINSYGWFLDLIYITIVFGIPALFYWSPFIAFSGRVYENQCISYAVYPEVAIAFSVSDFILGVSMSLLFLVPMYNHQRNIRNSKTLKPSVEDDNLRSLIRQNAIFSTLAIFTTLTALNVYAAIFWITRADGAPKTDYLREWCLFAMSIENWISLLFCHMMPSGWIPTRVRILFEHIADVLCCESQSTQTSDSNGHSAALSGETNTLASSGLPPHQNVDVEDARHSQVQDM